MSESSFTETDWKMTSENSDLSPDWHAGFDDQVNADERRRRRTHIENVHTDEYLVITDPRNQMIGTPLKVLGVSGPLILLLDDVNGNNLHCIDVRRHTFVHASDEYVQNYQKYAREKYNQTLALTKAKKGQLPFCIAAENPPSQGIPSPQDGEGDLGIGVAKG